MFQIKSHQTAKPEQKSPLHSGTDSPKPPCVTHWPSGDSWYAFLLSQGSVLLPAASSIVPASRIQLASFSASFLSLLFCLQEKAVKFPNKYFGGLVCAGIIAGGERGRGRVTAGSSAAAFALSIRGRSGKAGTQGAEVVRKGYFYAFLSLQFQITTGGGSVHH